eukprot:m.264545 g.264545  ORF g.264545 m.264545 type:complete len:525 (-) comp56821_c0_seq1:120-1694(-)
MLSQKNTKRLLIVIPLLLVGFYFNQDDTFPLPVDINARSQVPTVRTDDLVIPHVSTKAANAASTNAASTNVATSTTQATSPLAAGAPGIPSCVSNLGGVDRIVRNISGFGAAFGGTLFCHELCRNSHSSSPYSLEQFMNGPIGLEEWRMQFRAKSGELTPIGCDCLTSYDCDFASFSPSPTYASTSITPSSKDRLTFSSPQLSDSDHGDGASDFVIGHAQTYPWAKIEKFVITLRATGFKGGIHLRVDDAQKSDKTWVNRIKCYDVVLWTVTRDKPLHPQKERWVELATYVLELSQSLPKIGDGHQPLVIITDVRDTFFQANPFISARQWLPQTGETQLLLFPECKTLGNHVINFKWATTCWDKESRKIPPAWWKTAPIICSGGLVGTMSGVLVVAKAMSDELNKFRDDKCIDMLKPHDNGVDQGFLNHLFYVTDKLQPTKDFTKLMPSGVGPMAHISCWADWKPGLKEGCPLFRDPQGNVLSYDKQHSIIPMVHQYDRIGTVWRNLATKLPDLKKQWETQQKC